jgi:N-formylglutamate amidohydrolase
MIEAHVNKLLPIILSIPHSGTIYSQVFLKNILLNKKELQYSEDNYVDKVLSKSLCNNISYVKANFPRSFIDVNRSPLEIDPLMMSSDIPVFDAFNSSKVKNGIGVIHRVSYFGNEIYGRLLTRKEVINRLLSNYFPYHNALKSIIKKVKKQHDTVLVLDFHSMPSRFLNRNVDIIVGNNYNLSSNKILSSKLINYLDYYNYSSCINEPYSGGYITRFYGKPMVGVNVLQIEINRSLYMNEETLEIQNDKLNDLSSNINLIIKSLIQEINNYNQVQLN